MSKNTMAAIMRENSWVSRPKRRRRGVTKRNKNHRKARDQVNRDFSLRTEPNTARVGDIKKIPSDEGRSTSRRCSTCTRGRPY